ncbi:MAG: hypothetical protein MK008_00910 [Bdellovibrionales bacterium]|nr:hypothetical protein [Bdellovibrionales bacterium]
MPHFFKTINFYILFLLFLSIIGCKSKNPNPEFLDPIFLDYQSQYKEFSKEAESLPKQIESAQEELKEAAPRSTEKVVARRALKKLKSQHETAKQKAEYFKIRMEKRRIHSKIAYEKAFYNDEPWPDPKEYKAYQQNKKLRSANMNWNSRVPKLFKDNPNYENKE